VGQRGDVLAAVPAAVLEVERPHPVRVAIDGCSAAGKTTLGDELAAQLVVDNRDFAAPRLVDQRLV